MSSAIGEINENLTKTNLPVEQATSLSSQITHTPRVAIPKATTKTDAAFLSQSARVRLLEQQGLSPVEIAYQLNITQDTVLRDLSSSPNASTQTAATTKKV